MVRSLNRPVCVFNEERCRRHGAMRFESLSSFRVSTVDGCTRRYFDECKLTDGQTGITICEYSKLLRINYYDDGGPPFTTNNHGASEVRRTGATRLGVSG
jgi:hypothetical protein